MKTVYFVRHGQSENNATGIYNTPETPLSELGEKQAEDIARRCSKLSIEAIISSSARRAQQTATIVGRRISINFEPSDLFIERKLPSKLFGQRLDDPDVIRDTEMIYENFHDPGFRYEDGENFEDLKRRALACLEYLEKRNEKNFLVVSHGFFMWIIVAATLYGKDLTGVECIGIIRGLDIMENTALTILRTSDLSPKIAYRDPVSHWQLWVWNDHAHLG